MDKFDLKKYLAEGKLLKENKNFIDFWLAKDLIDNVNTLPYGYTIDNYEISGDKTDYDGSGLEDDVAEAMAVFNYDNGENDHTLMKQINAYVNEFLPSDSSVKTHYDPEKLSSLGKKIYYDLDAYWGDYKKKAEMIEFSNDNIAEGLFDSSKNKIHR
jgi:hypothetical protein